MKDNQGGVASVNKFLDISMPAHPFRPFESITESFAKKHISSPLMRRLFLWMMTLWRNVFGISDRERIIAKQLASDEDIFWHDTWIFDRLFYPEISASFVVAKDSITCPSLKAAIAIRGVLEFRDRLNKGEILPDRSGKIPQDMTRYHNMFSRLTNSTTQHGKMFHKVTDHSPSTYVTVMIRGNIFILPIFADQKLLPLGQISNSISKMIALSNSNPTNVSGEAIGLMTALNDKEGCRGFERLKSINQSVFELIDESLFHVSIDTLSRPENVDQTLKEIHAFNYYNRDHRRSFQIVVTANGRCGITVNPHAGIGGSYSARVCKEVHEASARFIESQAMSESNDPIDDDYVDVVPRPIELVVTQEVLDKFDHLKKKIEKRLYKHEETTSFRITNFERSRIIESKLSPDSIFHAALHLTYYKIKNQIPQVGNFISLRNVQHGDIWRYNSTSREIQEFCKSPTHAGLLATDAAHKALVKEHKKASDEFYLGAMFLKRFINQREIHFGAFVSLMVFLPIFIHQFVRKFMSPHLWVSSIPTNEGIESAGRAGSKLSYLIQDSLAGHYLIFEDHIVVCFLRPYSHRMTGLSERLFANVLSESIQTVQSLALSQSNFDAKI